MPHLEAGQFASRFVALVLGGNGFPARPLDRHVLLVSATLGLEPGRRYAERELNEELRRWTTRFGDAVGLDHVSLRRHLVDAGYVTRDSAGRSYLLAEENLPYTGDASIRALDLNALVVEARAERERRKREHLGSTAPHP